VLAGIAAAEAAGFRALKINCVLQRGVNESELLPLVERFRGTPHVLRFIEYMDVGSCNGWSPGWRAAAREARDRIAARWPLRPLSPAYRGEGGGALRLHRRRRRDRLRQFGQRAFLRRLPSRAAFGRRQAVHLPVRQ
jgi:molybdenum cofactor biosynthesis enzyme MoaA